MQLGAPQTARVVELAAREAVRVHHRHAVVHPRVAVGVIDVHAVVDDDRVVHTVAEPAEAAEASATVPGVEGLVRRQRNPAHVAESEAHAQREVPAGVAEEGHQRRPPTVAAVRVARPPAPATDGVMEPTPVVVRRPAPGLVANPGPAVVVDPGPASVAVRRPARADPRIPAGPVAGHVVPIAVVIQVVRASDGAAYVAVRLGLGQPLVAALVPVIPFTRWLVPGFANLEAVRPLADDQHAAPIDPSRAVGRGHFRFASADLYDGLAGTRLDFIAAVLLRPHGHERRLDVDIRLAAAQLAIGRPAVEQPHAKASIAQLRDLERRRSVQADQIRIVQLDLDPRARAGLHDVPFHQGRVDRSRNPVS